MRRCFKNFLCVLLSVIAAVLCFGMTAVYAADPAEIMFSSCESVVASNPEPTVDKNNYTEGAGSLLQQWDSRSNFNLYLNSTIF